MWMLGVKSAIVGLCCDKDSDLLVVQSEMLIGSLLTTIVYLVLIPVWLIVSCEKKKSNVVAQTAAAPGVKNQPAPTVQKPTVTKTAPTKPTTTEIQPSIVSKPLEDKTIVKLKTVEIKGPVKPGQEKEHTQENVEKDDSKLKTAKEKESEKNLQAEEKPKDDQNDKK
ncbi:hypothetical protein M3Y96_00426300 [Aphelenchoides besseyi]|nr:hypothetical protein M3Y96_00426300 [Aphelenchoides besseyi]